MATLNKTTMDAAQLPDAAQSVEVAPRYKELLDSNPYRDYEYKESWWQKALSALGFRTKADAYKESMALNAAEFDSAVLQKQMDEEYESPAAMAQRARASGLNPDLTGLQGVSGASPMREDTNNPIPPEDDMTEIMSFANQIMSCFSTAVGIAGDVQSLNSVRLGNEHQSLSNASSYLGLVQDVLTRSARPEDFGNANYHRRSVERSRGFASQIFPYGSRRYNKFMDLVQHSVDSMPTEKAALDAWFNRSQSRKSAYGAAYSSDYSESDEVLKEISWYLGQFAKETAFTENYTRYAKAQNDADYQDAYDGDLAGQAANEANSAGIARDQNTQWRASKVKEFNKLYDQMMNKIQDMAGKGNTVAACFITLLSVLRLQMLQI